MGGGTPPSGGGGMPYMPDLGVGLDPNMMGMPGGNMMPPVGIPGGNLAPAGGPMEAGLPGGNMAPGIVGGQTEYNSFWPPGSQTGGAFAQWPYQVPRPEMPEPPPPHVDFSNFPGGRGQNNRAGFRNRRARRRARRFGEGPMGEFRQRQHRTLKNLTKNRQFEGGR